MPDLNSLPPSRSPSMRSSQMHNGSPETFRPQNQPPSPMSRSSSYSVPTAAQTPAPLAGNNVQGSPRLRGSPRMERRRSSMLMSWNLDDGSRASPGMADPHHHRTPSLGELHQELENEQEAQVNRLLAMIRQQQAQIAHYQSVLPPPTPTTEEPPSATPSTATHGSQAVHTPSSSRPSSTAPTASTASGAGAASTTTVATLGSGSSHITQQAHPRTASAASSSLSRESSRRSRRSSASSARGALFSAPLSAAAASDGHEWHRDELSLYQAETAMVQRENAMLKSRIRELERMLAERAGGSAGAGGAGASAAAAPAGGAAAGDATG